MFFSWQTEVWGVFEGKVPWTVQNMPKLRATQIYSRWSAYCTWGGDKSLQGGTTPWWSRRYIPRSLPYRIQLRFQRGWSCKLRLWVVDKTFRQGNWELHMRFERTLQRNHWCWAIYQVCCLYNIVSKYQNGFIFQLYVRTVILIVIFVIICLL